MFTYEQVMDMGFPVPITPTGQFIHKEGRISNWVDWMPESFYTGDGVYRYLPTVEEVYATLRSGLFLKYVHGAKNGLCFQFWLSDPGFGDQQYASGKDLCEAICNAYLRSWCSPKNPNPNRPNTDFPDDVVVKYVEAKQI